MTSSHSPTEGLPLKVLTLNCWGLWIVATHRQKRLAAIAERLAAADYDIVCLQEVWCRSDWQGIVQACAQNLPFAHYFRSGIIGSGCAILSKYPIVETALQHFSCNGRPQRILHGDWLAGKCAVLARIQTLNGIVDTYTTHLIADYSADKTIDDGYAPDRTAQILEFLAFIRQSRRHHVLVCGDFNLNAYMMGIKLFMSDMSGGPAPLIDAWRETSSLPVHKIAKGQHLRQHRPQMNDRILFDVLNGYTCDTYSNTFTARLHRKNARRHKKDEFPTTMAQVKRRYSQSMTDLTDAFPGTVDEAIRTIVKGSSVLSQRIDYIFYARSEVWQCRETHVVMTEPVPALGCSYSDHYGVEAHFTLSMAPIVEEEEGAPQRRPMSSQTDRLDYEGDVLALLQTGLKEAEWQHRSHFIILHLLSFLILPSFIALMYMPVDAIVPIRPLWHVGTLFLSGAIAYELIQYFFVAKLAVVHFAQVIDQTVVFFNATKLQRPSE